MTYNSGLDCLGCMLLIEGNNRCGKVALPDRRTDSEVKQSVSDNHADYDCNAK